MPDDITISRRTLKVESVFSLVTTKYEWRDITVDYKTGEKLSCRVPVSWSDNAASILMSKYAVRAGVPDACGGVNGREVDAERIFDRLARGWCRAAVDNGYWSQADAINRGDTRAYIYVFYTEVKAMLEQQVAAPNSPQWFNTGVQAAYGVTASSDGHYYATVDASGEVTARQCSNSLEHPQVSACFIQRVEDDLVGEGGIMDLWTREARLFKYGSGSGANYSAIRGKGEPLSRGGASSGLISFLRVGDRSAGAIKSGGTTRRSARMIIVDDDHPDIEEFVTWKAREDKKIRALHAAGYGDPNSFEDEATETVSGQNANNSVAVSDAFMQAVADDQPWDLHARVDGSVTKTVAAIDLWRSIAEAAHACADPGLQFSDTLNRWHTCKADGAIRGSNPCAEYVFLDDTACNLASINLAKFCTDGVFDWQRFTHAIRLWTIVLDISVSMAGYPTAEIARRSMLYRTLGLGTSALGETLVLMSLGYGTDLGRRFAAVVHSTLTLTAYQTSVELAQRLGAFPRFDANRQSMIDVLVLHARAAERIGQRAADWTALVGAADRHGVRNAQVTLTAPCGTIGILMDCETTGVEPYYSDTAVKTLAGGGTMRLASRRFAETLEHYDYDAAAHTRRVFTNENGTVREYVWVDPPKPLSRVLVCADDLSPQQHIDMMAAIQPFLSGAISKTVNTPHSTTVDEIAKLYAYAHQAGLKSIAIYRDGCKPAQPLQSRKPPPTAVHYDTREAAERALALTPSPVLPVVNSTVADHLRRGDRLNPPNTARAVKTRVELSGHTFYLICGEHEDGTLAEVFVTCSRTGSSIAGWVNAWAKVFSLALQHGTPLDVLVAAMSGETFEPGGYYDAHPTLSPVDCFARIIAERYCVDAQPMAASVVAEVSSPVAQSAPPDRAKPTGAVCDNCGGTSLVRSGACYVCSTCGQTTGCS